MADKKLFELEIGTTPSTSDKIAYGKAGSSYKNITAANLRLWILEALPTPELETKIVNIGGYDMEGGDRNKEVSLVGVNRSDIVNVTVNIRSNDGGLYPMASPAGNDELRSWWRIMSNYSNPARIKLYSENNSYFDQGAFNGTSGNRGFIMITYET